MISIKLGRKKISHNNDNVYTIAEIGQNHQGDITIAKKMISEAKKAGCDCVKFQKSFLLDKFTKSALDRPYNSENSWGRTYGEHKEFLEFSLDQYKELQKFCKTIDIDFTASAMDETSLKLLDELNVPFIKVGSGDTNNFPMLEKIAQLKRPVIISTGMQKMETIKKVVEIMNKAKKTNFTLLHCVSAYPTHPKDCNLQIITLLSNLFPNIIIGYSGHEEGIEITKAAVLLGAKIVERHFTLDKSYKGSDHKCSLTPIELTQLILDINKMRNRGLLSQMSYNSNDIIQILKTTDSVNDDLKLALKDVTEKTIMPCEFMCKQKLGKSIVARHNLKKGHHLEETDICIKVSEPQGIPAEDYNLVLGAQLSHDVNEDFPITSESIS